MYQKYADEIKQTLDSISWDAVDQVVDVLHRARLEKQNIFVFGNGGSASTAQPMACDLNKNTRTNRYPPFRVRSLSDNMALFSAFANDEGYENVFVGQLQSFASKGDIVIAISASGNSPNVLSAVEFANQSGVITVGWSGFDGGTLARLVQFPVVIPNHCIEQIEDIHLMLEHMVTAALRAKEISLAQHNPDGLERTVGEHAYILPEITG